jgi:tetratricopeptide (TPR) repeat protein
LTWALSLGGRYDAAIEAATAAARHIDRLDDDRYVRIKSLGGLAFAYYASGRLNDARQAAGALLRIGTETGSSRAASLGHATLSVCATLSGDSANAIAHGGLAVDAAADPIYRDYGRIGLVHGLAAEGVDLSRLRTEVDIVTESSFELGLLVVSQPVATAAGLLLVMEGSFTSGMALLEKARDEAAERGNHWYSVVAEVFIGVVHARIATGQATASLTNVLRNPRFILRHALPAKRIARRELERLSQSLADRGDGLRFIVDYELGLVLSHCGETDDARSHFQRAAAFLGRSPDSRGRSRVDEALDSLDQPSSNY